MTTLEQKKLLRQSLITFDLAFWDQISAPLDPQDYEEIAPEVTPSWFDPQDQTLDVTPFMYRLALGIKRDYLSPSELEGYNEFQDQENGFEGLVERISQVPSKEDPRILAANCLLVWETEKLTRKGAGSPQVYLLASARTARKMGIENIRQTYEKIHAPGEREADNYMNQVFKNCRLRRAEGLIKEGPNWEKLAKFRDDGTLDRRVPPFRTERDYFHPAALQKGLYLRQKKILI